MSSNLVAIVGRPNVGKSTLFNRLVGERKAIVDDFSGVTRDRHYGVAEWQNREFLLVDTGGFVAGSDDVFEKEIANQVKIAVDESAVILFMVDVSTGITDLDDQMADLLRRSKKPVFVVVNKVDNNERYLDMHEFHALGFEHLYPLSSVSGSGTGELLEDIMKHLPEPVIADEPAQKMPRIAIVGRPNVGKSSLINALLGQERNIVTEIAGTTRDSIDTHYNAFGKEFILVDTAGIRKKGKVKEDIEFYSVMRSLRTLEQADVVILMIDATQGLDSQDLNLYYLAHKNGKGVVILVNKWDLMEKETNTSRDYEKMILEKLAPLNDVPVVFISATTKQRIHKAIETALQVYENRSRRITTHKLNDFLQEVTAKYQPPAIKGKFVKIKYCTQLPGIYPQFAFFCNLPQYIREPYKRYIENQLREHYDFKGVSMKLFFRKK
ncbi:MAG: ribosome biogenesis GTPase Der [Bacteroidia bacterium]|nr:ribosome biogenesis GTPase Der [Bacteroidia bacterium]MBP7260643.1 ribosome biogenesis GTPase Der [Bacteroidia bacterium]MBP9180025.1 ribosome biogenesis GTPase Der [Bacteroidia bacterium]MBP9723552.1 ribosome biogenesis GTPase Der [Bacteroidia bacterium]